MQKTRPENRIMLPPDGGWGWIVVLGVSLVNLAERSIEPSFGLLFGDILSDLSIATTGAGIIVSTYEAVFNFSGLFVGPLIKTYSYRKVAFFGALLAGIGLILTFPAASMAHILCTYSIINGLGVGFSSSATFVALNHYFKKKRGLAVGLTMTGTGVGLLLMPQAVRYLTEEYDFAGSMLIVGAFALNACVGSLVLQPVKWHLLKPTVEEGKLLSPAEKEENGNCPHITITHAITEKDEEDADEESPPDKVKPNNEDSKESATVLEKSRPLALMRQFSVIMRHNSLFDNGDAARTYQADFEESKNTLNKSSTETKLDKYFQDNNKAKAPGRRKLSEISYHTTKNYSSQVTSNISLHKSIVETNIGQNSFPTVRKRKGSTLSNLSNLDFTGSCLQIHAINHEVQDDIKSVVSQKSQSEPERKESIWSRFAHLMDLDLLKDPIFVNILFGLSIFYVAELNFKMIVPFFLAHLGHSKSETAFCLSMMAASDIVARILLPPICDRLTGTISRRTMFMVATIFCAVSRSALAESGEWIQLETILIISGFFRGATLINFMLVVSEYCDDKLEKLPAAFGLHMVAKGIFIVILGPLIGFIRDATGSYQLCIHAQSMCIFLCAIAWNLEKIILSVRKQQST